MHPDFISDLMFGIRVSSGKRLIGVSISYPVCISFGGTEVEAIHISQMGHEKYSWNRLSYMLVQETMRRADLCKIQHALLGIHAESVQPVTVNNDWWYIFDPPIVPLPDSVMTPGWRKMRPEDVPDVLALTNHYTSKFEIKQVFRSEEEFAHYFCPTIPEYVFSYVVEDPSTNSITDLVSFKIHFNFHNFYRRGPFTYDVKLRDAAQMIAIVPGKSPVRQLLIDSLVCARQEKVDIFMTRQFGLGIEPFIGLFGISRLNYHVLFYNYTYPEVREDNCWMAI